MEYLYSAVLLLTYFFHHGVYLILGVGFELVKHFGQLLLFLNELYK